MNPHTVPAALVLSEAAVVLADAGRSFISQGSSKLPLSVCAPTCSLGLAEGLEG